MAAASAVCLTLVAAPSTGTAAVPGDASLAAVGPIDNANGYPFWYQDHGLDSGLEPLRLELCLEAAMCGAEIPDPTADIKLPENYPDEGFWWAAEASIDRAVGKRAILVMAQEAAFGDAGSVAVGKQVAFSRQRVRVDGLVPGATYKVTGPYGVTEFVADADGEINDTQDIGCLTAPCGFDLAMTGHIGPFLRWTDWENNPSLKRTDPVDGSINQYVGDPAIEHTVEGSPDNTNFFRIEGPSVGGPGIDMVEQDLFSVTGKVAELKATIDKPSDLFGTATDVNIQSSFPAETDIVYSTDPDVVPAVDAEGNVTAGELHSSDGTADSTLTVQIPGPALDPLTGLPGSTVQQTTLRYLAVDRNTGTASPLYTQEYTVDTSLPVVSAANLGPAGTSPETGPFLQGPQEIELTAHTGSDPEATSRIYYTLDGTRPALDADGQPTGSTLEYDEPFLLTRSTIVNAVAVNDDGTKGPNLNNSYKVHHLKAIGPVGRHGFPEWVEDFGVPAADDPNAAPVPARLALCLDDPNCALEVPFDTQRASFPDNFPDESFWWAADAEIPVGADGRARLVLALEAAFAQGAVAPGDQIAFGRTRYSMRGLTPDVTYRITHPYGVDVMTADTAGDIRYTNDIGCMDSGCSFTNLFESGIGPFLKQEGAPEGYLGDGATEAPVTGSPFDTNFFRLEALSANGEATLVGETRNFSIVGRLASTPVPLPAEAPAAAAAPVINAAAARIGEATVQLAAPADGGSPITGFVVRAIDPAGNQIGALTTADATATSVLVTGLRRDVDTRFQVAAVNAVGTGSFSPASATLPALSDPFSDVQRNAQFFTEISWLADRKITTGYPGGAFQPMTSVSRAAMAAFLYRSAGSPDVELPATSPYTDVPVNHQFFKEIIWLKDSEITTGMTATTFAPETAVNRKDMAAFLYRFSGSPEYTEPATSDFTDVPNGYQFYKEVMWLKATGITTGFTATSYAPFMDVNRKDMAAFLYRFDRLAEGNES
ncbi:S-layer homology domain-containing protein [Pseudarthrobacter sp. NPDC058329]|uniref:S-layer homology domain-containing protein n=1 Tax=Pseudarthrobacter sp. NPDC058329 TaxID=3346448 RepID=UPI0036D872F0